MSRKRIGALTIGQSPRPDLVAPLMQLLPDCEIIQAGALDDLAPGELPETTNAIYPLVTRMQNGDAVMVDESFIAPKLQQAQNRLETRGVAATMLLCSGSFAHLHATRPIFKPFKIGCSVLGALNMKSIGLITPVAAQEIPIRQRWESMGYETTVWKADLGNQDQAFQQQIGGRINTNILDCIVLDYVGYPLAQVIQLQRSIDQPVIDLGYLAMVTLASTV
ncbi:MAG: AroM family protein [Anaerolineales bacterium]|nr:AroM family protein [Anaerolineales bacterium]